MSSSAEPALTLRWRRRPTTGRRRGLGRWLALVALLGGGAGATLFVAQHARMDGFERVLESGCDEVDSCKALEAEASARLGRCVVSCGREREHQREARHLLYRAEERRRVREHYRQSDALEGRIQETERERRIEDEERVLAAQARVEERHRKELLEVERAERERQDAKLAEQRARELRYLTLLSPAAREQRLKRCHEQLATCDALVELLLDAATDERERRRLVASNERALEDKREGVGRGELPSARSEPRAEEPRPAVTPTPLAVEPPTPAAASAAASVDFCPRGTPGCCSPEAQGDCPGS
jgi:dTMP kinase